MRKALVTGASRGIGRAIAESLRDTGYDVVGTSRQPAERSDTPHGITFARLDLNDASSIDSLMGSLGSIDLLVNNAGYSLMGPLDETPTDAIDAQIAANWTGIVRLTRAAISLLSPGGRIISIGSLQSRIPVPYCAVYAGNKGALEAFTRALREELRPRGIAASIVLPGFVQTRIQQDRYGATGSPVTDRLAVVQAFRDQGITGGIHPQDVARVVLRAVRAARPKAVYIAGRKARWFNLLRRILPERIFDSAYRRALGLPR